MAATDQDVPANTLTYSLGGTDASSFSIVSTSGQLQTSAALDRETKDAYEVTVGVSDGSLTDSITVTINVTNVNETPSYADDTATRSIAENTASGQDIGTAVAATDPDNDTLTYTLSGTDASSFSIVSTSGQLQTSAALNHETKDAYSVTVTAADANLSDSIAVTINVTDVNEAPAFASGTTISNITATVGTAITSVTLPEATDPDDGASIAYTVTPVLPAGLTFTASSRELSGTPTAETASATYTYEASDGTLSNELTFTIEVSAAPNNAPVFSDGASTTRAVDENTATGTNFDTAVAATDADTGDTLTYTLGGTDAASFSIVGTSGQLQTNAALDHETKDSYAVTVGVSDGNGGSDSITVTINVNDINEPPTFASGASISNITATEGEAITSVTLPQATDPDENATITYTVTPALPAGLTFTASSRVLSGTPTAAKASATYTYTASDGSLSNTLTFTIEVGATSNNAPTFTEGDTATRSVAENTASGQNIGTAVGATDADTTDTLTYSLGGTDAGSFSIVSTSGQLQTKNALNFESKTSYSVTITVDDGNGANNTDSITVTINVTNVNEAPTLPSGRVIIAVDENTASDTNIGTAFTATDPDSGDTLTYSLRRGDASSFSIDSSTGQLKTNAALDFETKSSYSDLVVRATDSGSLFAARLVTVNVNDINEAPAFASGASISNITATVSTAITSVTLPEATDPDAGDSITYTLTPALPAGLTFTASSRILAGTPTAVKASTTYTYKASDGNLSNSLTFTIAVSAANTAPVFSEGTSTTRSVAENTVSGTNIGTAVGATDADNDTLTYTLGGTDSASFSIVSTSGQLQTNAALNHESKSSYSVTVSVSDGNGGSDSITVTISVTNVNEAPAFANGASISNIAATTNTAITSVTLPQATDPEGNTITYTLTPALPTGLTFTDSTRVLAGTPTVVSNSATYTYKASDGSLSNSLTFTIAVSAPANNAPVFTDGTSTTRSIAENTASGQNIGSAVGATDADNDTLTYTLGGTDAASFSIVSTSGQLQTSAALNHESKSSYSVTVEVSDGNGGSDSIGVTISVTNVNEAPAFDSGASISNITATTNTAITSVTLPEATDPESNTITYTLTPALPAGLTFTASTRALAGTPTAASASATYTYKASDGTLSNSLTFTIEVSTPNNAPVFSDGTSTTRAVDENTASGQNIGTAVGATDSDGHTLTYTLSGTDAASFGIVSTSGQLQTSVALNHETKDSYSVTVGVSDGNGGTDSIAVTINVNDVNEAPAFANTASISNITATVNTAITSVTLPEATDPDAGASITYTLTPALPAGLTFTDSTRALAGTPTAAKTSTTYTYTASDGSLSASLTFTIEVSAANSAPVFSDGTSTTRSVAENTASGQNIGTAVGATDADTGDTLTYTLSGTDAASFSIVSTSGQLQTSAALNFESKTSYSVTVGVSDGNGGTDSITVTISVTNVNEAPAFANTATISNIAATVNTAITSVTLPEATDPDGTTPTYTLTPALPAGLTFTASTRALAGTPTAAKTSTTYTYTASDGSLSATLTFTIEVSAANSAPVFSDGTSTTRSVAENTASGTNIGTAVGATDADNDTLTYTLGGTDAASFSIVSTSGQLQTSVALNHESKSSYSVTVSVSDGNGGTDSITVTISVTDVNEAPAFASGASISNITATVNTAITSVTLPEATDPEGNTITYTVTPTLPTGLSFTASSRELSGTPTAAKALTTYTYKASDGNSSNELTFTIAVNASGNSLPAFSDGDSTTRSVAENTASGQNIGTAVAATDADTGDTLTYSLSGTDAASFSIVDTSGQLQTKASLNYEAKTSYTVTVSVSDGNGGSDSITVTINVTDNTGEGNITLKHTSCTLTNELSIFFRVEIDGVLEANRRVTLTGYTVTGRVGGVALRSGAGYNPTASIADQTLESGESVTFSISGQWVFVQGASRACTVHGSGTVAAAAPAAQAAQAIPLTSKLLPNFPNPFNPETWIPYELSESADVALTIYNMRGVVVREIKLGHQPAGIYRHRSRAIHWDGRNAFGEKVASGVYFYTLKAGDYVATRKLLIRK